MDLKQRLKEQRMRSIIQFSEEEKQALSLDSKQMKEYQLAKKSLQVGDKVPMFTLENATGKKIKLEQLLKQGGVVISFYRGSWCPYCRLELEAFQKSLEELKLLGLKVVAISFENQTATKTMQQQMQLSFDLLKDENQTIAQAFGLVFRVNPSIVQLYLKMGYDLLDPNRNYHGNLVIPATYVVNQQGEIVFAYVDEEYTRRYDPATLVQRIKNNEIKL